MKVILIDDESLANEALKIVLNQIGGVQIQGAYTNLQEAIHAIREHEVDVIFLDIEMGAAHGLDIAKRINEEWQNIKVVFVTAHAEFAVDAFEISAYDYLLKPVRKERLEKTLHRIQAEMKQMEPKVEEKITTALPLTINAMGNFQLLHSDKKEIKWRTKKVKELFAYIWHHYPNPVPRAHIIEDIWGEQHGDSAVQLMHTSFYHLRKTIRDIGFQNPVEFVNEQYALALYIDSDNRKLEEIMASQKITDVEIEKMIELYKGNYLEEDNYEWALPKQQQLKTRFLTTLEKFVVEKMDNDDLSRNLEICLEKMIKVDPYNERFVYLAIDYYGRTKNISKIIRIAGKFEELWTRELGITIPEEISSIYYKYITGRPDK